MAALLAYEAQSYRRNGLANLQTQGELVSRSSAPALAFDDRKAAQESLDILRFRDDIVSAVLYSEEGGLFAFYHRDGRPVAATAFPDWVGSRVESEQLVVVQRIVENDVPVGTLEIRSQYQLWTRLTDYLIILASVMTFSLVIALLITIWLRRSITEPIVALTDAAHAVVETRNFSLRVPRRSEGEMGILVDAFNTMLVEVGHRARELESSNAILTRETRDRAAAEAALRVADRRKDEFLAILAHELRNPLAPIANALAILRSVSLDATAAKMTGLIERQVRQLVRLVDDLLDVSRITTGKLVLRKTVVDLIESVHSAVDAARPLMVEKRHEIVLELPPEPVLVEGDQVRLVQVVSNLLNNAGKYTEPGGRINVTLLAGEGWAQLEIADSGIGIAPDMLGEIFEMFRQGDNSLERTQSGLGVGLSLARRLVELHGGRIQAASPGRSKGSVFEVWLPLHPTQAAATPEAVELADASGTGRRRIMVVDDNIDFVDTLAALLSSLGHEVRVAHDANGALEIVRGFAPHFAFLDIGMPGMNGYELAKKLRSFPETARTVLIAATGYGQEDDRELARLAGFDRHIVKPVELHTVEAILAAFSQEAVRQE